VSRRSNRSDAGWPPWAIRVWFCIKLAQAPDAFLALLDGEPVPAKELDQDWCKWLEAWDALEVTQGGKP
jgi:hypothetical protein